MPGRVALELRKAAGKAQILFFENPIGVVHGPKTNGVAFLFAHVSTCIHRGYGALCRELKSSRPPPAEDLGAFLSFRTYGAEQPHFLPLARPGFALVRCLAIVKCIGGSS